MLHLVILALPGLWQRGTSDNSYNADENMEVGWELVEGHSVCGFVVLQRTSCKLSFHQCGNIGSERAYTARLDTPVVKLGGWAFF